VWLQCRANVLATHHLKQHVITKVISMTMKTVPVLPTTHYMVVIATTSLDHLHARHRVTPRDML
jgi:hypothetical protein